jgi:hypothetical protein
MMKYKTFCDVVNYISNAIRVKIFGLFFKEYASIVFRAWNNSQENKILWRILKKLATKTYHKPHQHFLDVSLLGAIKYNAIKNLFVYAKNYKTKHLFIDVRKIHN